MEKLETPEPVLASPVEKQPSAKGTFFQFVAPVLAIPVVGWGVFMVWATGSLPPCGGELGLVQLGMVGSWMIAIPASLFALVAALTVKNGSPSLRKMCFVTSAVVLIAPIITSILFSRWHCS
jgi:hypothetical protein